MENVKKIFANLAKTLLFVGLMVIIGFLLNYSWKALPFAKNINRLISEGFTIVVVLVLYYLFMVKWSKIPFSKLNIFPSSQRFSLLGYGILIGFALLIAVFFIIKSLGAISISALENLNITHSVFILFITMLFAAIWEEVAFRGCILQMLSESVGIHPSCIIVASSFGLLHCLSPLSSPQIVISTFMSGMLLGYAYFYAGNLYLPIGIHFGWNFLNSLLFSGKLYNVEYLNNALAGTKNPEQGMVAIVMTGMAAACLAVLYVHKNRRTQFITEAQHAKRDRKY
ncbi:MAG: CPBP family intramembrane metalloprotease [Deltaproteobacteria bacterium]|nr:CPBP family intramembrane metalloprotease [Deltaproteobacteria bacterium]MBI2974120.1 CPBP family intramembrane metalloprotease [Deltaproteobacteria bacterium]